MPFAVAMLWPKPEIGGFAGSCTSASRVATRTPLRRTRRGSVSDFVDDEQPRDGEDLELVVELAFVERFGEHCDHVRGGGKERPVARFDGLVSSDTQIEPCALRGNLLGTGTRGAGFTSGWRGRAVCTSTATARSGTPNALSGGANAVQEGPHASRSVARGRTGVRRGGGRSAGALSRYRPKGPRRTTSACSRGAPRARAPTPAPSSPRSPPRCAFASGRCRG